MSAKTCETRFFLYEFKTEVRENCQKCKRSPKHKVYTLPFVARLRNSSNVVGGTTVQTANVELRSVFGYTRHDASILRHGTATNSAVDVYIF